jgi:hypothetical protein
MPRLHDQNIDPIKTPLDIAEQMYHDQLEAAIDIVVPNRRDPFVKRLHESGLTLKGFQDVKNV